MNRQNERKELGASMARSPAKARKDEDEDLDEGHVSREEDDPVGRKSEDASMARTRGAAHAGEEREMKEDEEEQAGDRDVVKGGRGIKRETVEADHVMGDGGEIGVKSAEGEADMASAKANRKEAGEPEREMNEKAAMGGERTVPHKNTMSHGERETIARNTI